MWVCGGSYAFCGEGAICDGVAIGGGEGEGAGEGAAGLVYEDGAFGGGHIEVGTGVEATPAAFGAIEGDGLAGHPEAILEDEDDVGVGDGGGGGLERIYDGGAG